MRRLLIGYPLWSNRRHGRSGRLFRNRFKPILCEEDVYLLEVVRYIHLNPIRTGLVEDLYELGRYAYSGHSVLIGKKNPRQDTQGVLRMFGDKLGAGRQGYRSFGEKGIAQARHPGSYERGSFAKRRRMGRGFDLLKA